MIHAICDFCGKDCDRTAMQLTMTPFQNFARYHTDNKPFGNTDKPKNFIMCPDCIAKHNLPNPYGKYDNITNQQISYDICLDDHNSRIEVS